MTEELKRVRMLASKELPLPGGSTIRYGFGDYYNLPAELAEQFIAEKVAEDPDAVNDVQTSAKAKE